MSIGKRATIYSLCQILGWGIYATANLLFLIIFAPAMSPLWRRYAAVFGSAAVIAILSTHLYRFHIKRRGWLLLTPLRVFPRVIASSLILGFLITAQVSIVWLLFFGTGPFRRWDWLPGVLLQWTSSVFIWTVLYFGVHYFEQYRRAELEKLQIEVVAKEAQLQRLVSQINPHFIFNCLNSLRALILEDPPRAQTMVTELSELLRYSLQPGKTATVSLGDELAIVDTYLQLEAIRFEERLTVKIDTAPETLSMQLPPMLLQSLVENGVRHGIEKLPQGGEIRVTSKISQDALKITVINSGQLSDGSNSTKLGLANARERLRLLYGGAASLVLTNYGADSVLAEISIPADSQITRSHLQ
jgi:hypothetical protein